MMGGTYGNDSTPAVQHLGLTDAAGKRRCRHRVRKLAPQEPGAASMGVDASVGAAPPRGASAGGVSKSRGPRPSQCMSHMRSSVRSKSATQPAVSKSGQVRRVDARRARSEARLAASRPSSTACVGRAEGGGVGWVGWVGGGRQAGTLRCQRDRLQSAGVAEGRASSRGGVDREFVSLAQRQRAQQRTATPARRKAPPPARPPSRLPAAPAHPLLVLLLTAHDHLLSKPRCVAQGGGNARGKALQG